jgi:hypothetical protein
MIEIHISNVSDEVFFEEIRNSIIGSLEMEEYSYNETYDKNSFRRYPSEICIEFEKGNKQIRLDMNLSVIRADNDLPECEECPEEKDDDKDKKIADLESRIKDLQAIVKFLSF